MSDARKADKRLRDKARRLGPRKPVGRSLHHAASRKDRRNNARLKAAEKAARAAASSTSSEAYTATRAGWSALDFFAVDR
jgi:hypothetical protein